MKDRSDWELEDAEQYAQAHADAFFVPALTERTTQRVGDLVRLHFTLRAPVADAPRAERMWVEITQALADDVRYCGVLTNVRGFIKNIRQGDELVIEPRHLARSMIKRSDPRWAECTEQKAMVSAMALGNGEMIRFAYREKPDRPDDSDWRMFTDHEREGYVDDPGNIRLCDVGWLLDEDPSLDFFIREPIGAAFKRRVDDEPWVRVTDWNPETD